MLEWTLIRGIMVAFFILANSFFVAAEFALVSVRETRVQQLIELGRPGARTVLELKRHMDDFLPAVQFGVTLAALALGWVGEPALASVITLLEAHLLPNLSANLSSYTSAVAVTCSFALITYFEVLLGELVPKSLALQRAERIALAVAGPMDVFIRITRPAVRLMNASASLVLRLFKAPLHGDGAVHSPEELKMIATATRRMGLLPSFQEDLIHRAIELSQVAVREIMTPRGSIFALPADMPLEAASARIVEEGHTRVPVFENGPAEPGREPEHIIGLVHSKDIARLMHFRASSASLLAAGESGLTLRGLMREVLFMPETKLVVELLQEFQERRRQIAIVVDEFGSTVGLVTAEDALEAIVGELRDEFDDFELSAPGTVRRDDEASAGSARPALLDGTTTLRDLSTRLGWQFPRRPGVETLAGFLLAELGHLPAVGEFVLHGDRRFEIVAMEGRRIREVRVEAIGEGHASDGSGDRERAADSSQEVSA